MLAYLRRTLAAWLQSELSDAVKEIASLRNQLQSLRTTKADLQTEFERMRARHGMAQEEIVIRTGEADELLRQCSAAQSEVGRLTGVVADLRGDLDRQQVEINRLEVELDHERHEHSKTSKELELAGKENELLAKIHETNLAMRERELSLEKRGKAEAEVATSAMKQTASETE